jgi:4-amino-4-deoxy-L-arabinose transferase-like glycosyltransferase
MATLLSSLSPAQASGVPGWRQVLARPWASTQGCLFVLGAWCLFLFFYGLQGGDLWRTEGLRAIIAQEMLRTGNWVVPMLYGEPLFTKPPGMYLAVVLCSYPLGVVMDWSARLPSALAGTITVFLFFAFFKRFLGRQGGLVAALILPMSGMWLEKVPSAEIDMLQVAWVTASLLCFFRALEEEEKNRTAARWWYGAMLALAGGILTKWTAPAFLYATAVPLLWWRGRLRLLFCRHHLLGLLLACTLCLVWIAAAVSITGWDIFYETVKREGLSRLVPSYDRPYRWGEALVHPFKLLLTTLPWSLFALLALRPSFYRQWDEQGHFLLQALHAWTWPNMLVWSYMAEHTARHSFPLFPGIAGLAVMVWVGWYQGKLRWGSRLNPKRVLLATLAVFLVVKVLFVEVVQPGRTGQRRPREKGQLLASLVPWEQILYLFRVKDEGVMFYYGRTVIRLASPADLPVSPGLVYCILVPDEWRQWDRSRPAEVVREMLDEQGDQVLLVRVWN